MGPIRSHVCPWASPTLYDYKGYDTYMGIGLGFKTKTLTFAIEYLEHNMDYDAKSMGGELKYNF